MLHLVARLKLLDVDVTLPANVLLVASQLNPRIESYRVTGPGVAQVRDQMVSLGVGLGYNETLAGSASVGSGFSSMPADRAARIEHDSPDL